MRIRRYASVFLLVVLLFTGCSSKSEIIQTNKVYDIIRRGNQYSIRVKKDSEYVMGYNRADGLITDQTPRFANLPAMKQAILEGGFSAAEFKFATSYLKDCAIDSYEAEIYNPYELYQPYAPEGVVKYSDIGWQGKSYSINYRLKNYGESLCTVHIWREKEYLSTVAKLDDGFADIKEAAKIEGYPKYSIIEEKGEPDASKYSILYTKTWGNRDVDTYFEVREKYTTPEKSLQIQYLYSNYDGAENAVPQQINVYGTENGGFFYVQLYNLTETLDVDFLSQFGITPYEGNEPSPEAIG